MLPFRKYYFGKPGCKRYSKNNEEFPKNIKHNILKRKLVYFHFLLLASPHWKCYYNSLYTLLSI